MRRTLSRGPAEVQPTRPFDRLMDRGWGRCDAGTPAFILASDAVSAPATPAPRLHCADERHGIPRDLVRTMQSRGVSRVTPDLAPRPCRRCARTRVARAPRARHPTGVSAR